MFVKTVTKTLIAKHDNTVTAQPPDLIFNKKNSENTDNNNREEHHKKMIECVKIAGSVFLGVIGFLGIWNISTGKNFINQKSVKEAIQESMIEVICHLVV